MRRLVAIFAIAVMMTTGFGCGGSVEKNKNKDLDRPKPASEK